MCRSISLWLALGVLAVGSILVSACSAVPGLESTEVQEESQVQTAPVRQGDITISATGAGSVIPAEEIVVGFKSSGVLEDLLVAVGDRVQAGDVLARLDGSNARQEVAAAELQLAEAIMRTDAAGTEAGISFNDIAVEQALLSLQQAQETLDELVNWAPEEDDITQAQANLDAAKAGYNAALGQESASSNTITIKQIDLESAQRAVAEAEESVRVAYDPGRDWELYIDDPSCRTGEQYPNCTGQPYSDAIKNEREAADNALVRATENLKIAEANYNSAVSSTNYSSSANAQSSILAAEMALKAAQEGPTEEEIQAAKTAVRQAELAHQQALLNQEADKKIGLAQAQLALDSAEQALADTELVARSAGTVMSILASPGEMVSAGQLLTLADLSQPILEVYLDETDLDKVGVGYEVEVVFDAFPDDTYTGHVTEVDPMLSSVNGVTTVRALVQLDESSFNKPLTLPAGLNAAVEVIGGRTENALLVPVEALREYETGKYSLFVLTDSGEPELRFVEVGLMDYSFAEILSGVEMGETVTTGLVETQQ